MTGSAVMFVLYDGAWIDIAGGADINLTAMQASDLMSLGVSADDANELAGMLVFEDRDSAGSNKTQLNGNANTVGVGIGRQCQIEVPLAAALDERIENGRVFRVGHVPGHIGKVAIGLGMRPEDLDAGESGGRQHRHHAGRAHAVQG